MNRLHQTPLVHKLFEVGHILEIYMTFYFFNKYVLAVVNNPQTVYENYTPIAFVHAKEPEEEEEEEAAAGHDSPNWGKSKSYTVLFGCTLLYAIIAEILVDTVDLVMEGVNIDEKFLGLTLFALVPNITEFMNAISFALNGNIVLRFSITF